MPPIKKIIQKALSPAFVAKEVRRFQAKRRHFPNRMLVGTHHKTGTVWFTNVFTAIAEHFGLRYQGKTHEDPKPHGLWDIFHNKHSQFDLPQGIDFRGVHVIRDPRDLIVSATFYHQRATDAWLHQPQDEFDGMTYMEKINSLESFDDQLLFEMQRMSVFDIGQMRDFDYDDDRFMTVKYEDMICDYDMRRFEEIFRFMGISEQAMGWCLTLALRNCLFSGSVKSTHVRSGKGKQWVEHFKPQHKEKFDELFPGILDRLGYEPGDSWNER